MLYYIQAFVKALLKYNTQQITGRIAHTTGYLSFMFFFSASHDAQAQSLYSSR